MDVKGALVPPLEATVLTCGQVVGNVYDAVVW
jgi:hypothetical protein